MHSGGSGLVLFHRKLAPFYLLYDVNRMMINETEVRCHKIV